MESLTDIQQFYRGTTIFVTGGTGFLGNVLLTKLLRSCPGINTIYVLVRQKKSLSPEQRFQDLFSEPILEKINENCPNYKDIIKMMPGDCMEPNLGLSEDNLSILKNQVDVIFHIAATINFTAPLYEAVPLNIGCTEELLNIAAEAKKLKVFLHVSTAFVHYIGRDELEEKLYNTPIASENILQIVKLLDKDTITKIQPAILGPYPNTYVYTKTLAEGICEKYWSRVPVVIFRPAIVLSTFKEPTSGWINSIHGAIGIFATITLAMLKTILVRGDSECNVVPCDYVINAMLAASASAGCQNLLAADSTESSKRIYNFGSSCTSNSYTWDQFLARYRYISETFPSSKSIGSTYSFSIQSNRFLYQLHLQLFHILPAYTLDTISKFTGKSSRLLSQYDKLHKLVHAISAFVLSNWFVKNENTEKLYESLSERDRKIFNFDLNDLDWDAYIKEIALGVRTYILKDDMRTLPAAKAKRNRILFWRRLFSLIFTVVFVYVIYTCTESLRF